AAAPNPAHIALAQLEQQGYLKAVITQNIDMLHARAGTQCVYELHGHMREATCIQCFRVYPAEPIMLQFIEDHQVPHCPHCDGVLKPNVVLFGEQLPFDAFQAARVAARSADLLLMLGSSLEVAPANELPKLALGCGAQLVIINLDETHLDAAAQVVLHADVAEALPQIVQCLEEAA
ncbi:MAG: hypothetical protein GYB67_05640, partial [Chloroflexi bacterium]|nr:hypothetical protein [Chloroflexota bacterium]